MSVDQTKIDDIIECYEDICDGKLDKEETFKIGILYGLKDIRDAIIDLKSHLK